MELHLEFFKVKPVFGFAGVQVVVEVTSRITKTVEFSVWSEKDGGRCLLIGYTGVPTLPTPGKKDSYQYMCNKSICFYVNKVAKLFNDCHKCWVRIDYSGRIKHHSTVHGKLVNKPLKFKPFFKFSEKGLMNPLAH